MHTMPTNLLMGHTDSEEPLSELSSGHSQPRGGVGEHDTEVVHIHLGRGKTCMDCLLLLVIYGA